jgi:hypothetical protein
LGEAAQAGVTRVVLTELRGSVLVFSKASGGADPFVHAGDAVALALDDGGDLGVRSAIFDQIGGLSREANREGGTVVPPPFTHPARAEFRVHVRFLGDAGAADVGATDASFTPDADAGTFVVPANARGLAFTLVLADLAAPAHLLHVDAGAFPDVPVFGGASKTLYFSKDGDELIEGGDARPGATLHVAYDAERAAKLFPVARDDHRLVIGSETVGGSTFPLYGELVREVTCNVSFDDGATWRRGIPLPDATATSPVAAALGYPLFGALGLEAGLFQADFAVPADALRVRIAFDVHAHVVANFEPVDTDEPYTVTKNVKDGAILPLGDHWDTPRGAGTNFTVPVGDP